LVWFFRNTVRDALDIKKGVVHLFKRLKDMQSEYNKLKENDKTKDALILLGQIKQLAQKINDAEQKAKEHRDEALELIHKYGPFLEMEHYKFLESRNEFVSFMTNLKELSKAKLSLESLRGVAGELHNGSISSANGSIQNYALLRARDVLKVDIKPEINSADEEAPSIDISAIQQELDDLSKGFNNSYDNIEDKYDLMTQDELSELINKLESEVNSS
jgi:hypothetical protein